MKLDATQVIKRPLITEKTAWEAEARNRYSFEVAMKADKTDIKSAVKAIYGVEVEKVSTQIRKGKYFRTRFGPAKTSTWKKATVELKAEQTIELF
ncbi:50S ribosomal protein L23 [Poriferisphaera corsica]|uniref:Large ribosomal subunit protein uL23 n=1 Tax=Poriferisphaera corsica TaxID=2528020 RepID=A0A517YT32_9BACT|nr:50S ribosomal protein L23 [Poriferisphaera corsica]QDU33374.1 50S ribosomal protein L23 [Poriferisphaera corsica]